MSMATNSTTRSRGRMLHRGLTEAEVQMYLHLLDPILQVCEKYGAWLDLTIIEKPRVVSCSAQCRRSIRRLYQHDVQEQKAPRTLYLRGVL